MLLYVFRALKSRSCSFLLAILGLAIALGATLSVARIHGLLESGTPRGTRLTGEAWSVFMHSETMRFDFFLGPRQIEGLQEHFGTSGYVLGSAGTRSLPIYVETQSTAALVDVVSPNFFEALHIDVDGVDTSAWGRENVPTALVSYRWLARMGRVDPPSHLRIGERVIRVAGVVPTFSGLWDQFTEVWVDWRLGPELLFPSVANVSVADQPWFYWTLALAREGRQAEFDARAIQGFARVDLVEPPFESFRVVSGITNQPDARRTADDSVRIYLFMAWVGLLASAVNLACWCALTRIVKADAEWTMLCLGISGSKYRTFEVSFIAIPVLFAGLMGLPLSLAFDALVARDPAVAALMNQSAELRAPFPWAMYVAGLGALFVVVWSTSKLVARAAGLKFGSATLRPDSLRVRGLFRALTLLMSTLAAMSLIIGYWSGRSSLDLWADASQKLFARTWVMQVKASDAGAKRTSLFPEDRADLISALRGALPEAQYVGFASTRPYSDARIPFTEFTLGNGQKVSVLVNETDGDAIAAMGASLRVGTLPPIGSLGFDIVLDTDIALLVTRSLRVPSALGATMTDAAGIPYNVVGIVDRLSYSSDLARSSPVAYIAMGAAPPALNLVVRGAVSDKRMRELTERTYAAGVATVGLASPQRLDHLADRALARYLARVTFCLATAIATLLIGIMSIGTIVLVEMQRSLRRIAIMSSLGATDATIAMTLCRGVILSVAAGAALGSAAAFLGSAMFQGLFLLPPGGAGMDAFWPAPVLSGVALCGALALIRRMLSSAPLYQHLRSE